MRGRIHRGAVHVSHLLHRLEVLCLLHCNLAWIFLASAPAVLENLEDNVLLAAIIALGNVGRHCLFGLDVIKLADELHELFVVDLTAAIGVCLSPSFFDGWNELVIIQGLEEFQINEDGGDFCLVDFPTPVRVVAIEQFHGALLVEVASGFPRLQLWLRSFLLGSRGVGLDDLWGLRNLLVPVGEVAVILHV